MERTNTESLVNLVKSKINIDEIEKSIKSGVEINKGDEKGKTPLIWATQKNRHKLVKLLLEYNVQLDIQDQDSKSALLWAASKKKDSTIFQLLLNAGADYKLKDKHQRDSLYLAIQNNNEQTVELLLKAGAYNYDYKFEHSNNIELAAKKGNIPILEMLLVKDKIIYKAEAKGSYLALIRASEEGHEKIVRMLLDRVDTPNIIHNGFTPLMWAVIREHWLIVELLLLKGANPHIERPDKKTAIIYAANKYDNRGLKLLLNQPFNVNNQDSDGLTALMHSAKNGLDLNINILIESGADINIQDYNGYTPLMWAAKNAHEETMKLLLNLNADPHIKDRHGDSAVFIAIEDDRQFFRTTITHLLEKKYDLDGNLTRVTKMFLDAGVDKNDKDGQGYTLIDIAKMRKLNKMTNLLETYLPLLSEQ